MIEAIIYNIYRSLPQIVFTSWILILLVITYGSGNWQAHHVWKSNLKYHLDDVMRDEIEERDARIKELEAENKALREFKKEAEYKLRVIREII